MLEKIKEYFEQLNWNLSEECVLLCLKINCSLSIILLFIFCCCCNLEINSIFWWVNMIITIVILWRIFEKNCSLIWGKLMYPLGLSVGLINFRRLNFSSCMLPCCLKMCTIWQCGLGFKNNAWYTIWISIREIFNILLSSSNLFKTIVHNSIVINMSSLVFEVFAPLVSIAPLALLVLLYYINMRSEDRQARGHWYPIRDTGDAESSLAAIPQQPWDDGLCTYSYRV